MTEQELQTPLTEAEKGDLLTTVHAGTFTSDCIRRLYYEIDRLRAELVKEGPLNAENWTLDDLLAELEKWKRIASGKTCVSFNNLCFGASSLWHQTHRNNFRQVDRKPEALSQWVLEQYGCVKEDFPSQVLEILTQLKTENNRLREENERFKLIGQQYERDARKHFDQACTNLRLAEQLQKENERLKRGDFTPEEFQHLCHNRHEKPGCTREEFKKGCKEYQEKLFGPEKFPRDGGLRVKSRGAT